MHFEPSVVNRPGKEFRGDEWRWIIACHLIFELNTKSVYLKIVMKSVYWRSSYPVKP